MDRFVQIPEAMCDPSLRGEPGGNKGVIYDYAHVVVDNVAATARTLSIEMFQRGVPRAPQCSAAGHA